MLHDALTAPLAEPDAMRRALAAMFALSLSAAPLGLILMLRRMSLIGDALSHAILPGVAIVSVKGSDEDLVHLLFGSVLSIGNAALLFIAGVASVSLVALALIWRPLVLDCVDPGFLRSVSRAGGAAHVAFLALMVLNLVGGFLVLGTLLAVGLMMLPAFIARFWARDLTVMMVVAVGSAIISGFVGLFVAARAGLPAGPAIILVAGALYLLSVVAGTVGGLIWLLLPRRHLEA